MAEMLNFTLPTFCHNKENKNRKRLTHQPCRPGEAEPVHPILSGEPSQTDSEFTPEAGGPQRPRAATVSPALPNVALVQDLAPCGVLAFGKQEAPILWKPLESVLNSWNSEHGLLERRQGGGRQDCSYLGRAPGGPGPGAPPQLGGFRDCWL